MDTTELDAEEEASISDDRFNVFKKSLTQLFRESRAQSIAMTRFKEALDTEHKSNPFKKSEIVAGFSRMTEANQIMVADDIIFLIWFRYSPIYLIFNFIPFSSSAFHPR